MKKYLLPLLLWVFAISYANAQLQYKIAFSYDSAGNQILRDRVCINCQSSKAAVDSTKVANLDERNDLLEDDDMEDSKNYNIMAYPNPVTDILKVEWVNVENNVKQIVVFSSGNRQILSKNIASNQGSIDLDFSIYPPGMYIVLVMYTDNSKQSFQAIKK